MRVSKEGEEITIRFFKALENLRQNKRIRGLKTFTNKHNINYWNFCTIKNEPGIRTLKPEYLYYLVSDYGISANWLLTGNGEMYESQISKS